MRLREVARQRAGREPTPSGAIVDSQSAQTHLGGPRRFDVGKKVSGRKRHLLVDTLGLLLKVVVHPANLHDRLGAKLVLDTLGTAFPRLQHIWADQGYAGTLRQWTAERLGIELEVVYPWWRQLKHYLPDLLDDMALRLVLMSSRVAGSWKEPSPGSAAHADCVETTSAYLRVVRRWSM